MSYFIRKIFLFIFILITSSSFADSSFEILKKKQTPFLDFFLLKLENKLMNRSRILDTQAYAVRVQYSNVGIDVDLDNKDDKIYINIYAIMDKNRYRKKKYRQKLSDCNQVRNLLFYKKYGYTTFKQKRDPNLSEGIMTDIFKESFLNNISLSEKEVKLLLDKMNVIVTIYHPVDKTELTCKGKVNDYELK